MSITENLKPKKVFQYFEEICQIPHGSGNTKEISDYLVEFAKARNLSYHQDEWNNVIIYKDAAKGYENVPPVILQGHMDMVCQKEPGSNHDFEKDPISLVIDGDYLTADGTTLGGDDGIAVAYCLAILDENEMKHPALECVFTVDEEVGLIGAGKLDYSLLKGKTMINLDSEEEGIFYVACAGGTVCTCSIPVQYEEVESDFYEITITGLLGGHSGTEINKNRANGDILMGRLLFSLREDISYALGDIYGGDKDTAICREAKAVIAVDASDEATLKERLAYYQEQYAREYAGIENQVTICVTEIGHQKAPVLHPVAAEKILFFLKNFPYGILKMSGTLDNLVETSANLGMMDLEEECFKVIASVRSSVEFSRNDLASRILYLCEFLGGEGERSGDYPAWEFVEESPIQELVKTTYKDMYGQEPVVCAIHAGLECGLFYKGVEGLDCISMGPDVLDVHTSNERLGIASVKKNYDFLIQLLSVIKK